MLQSLEQYKKQFESQLDIALRLVQGQWILCGKNGNHALRDAARIVADG